MNGRTITEQIFLDEAEGKNKAINAYDSILWKVRQANVIAIVIPMLFVSIGISVGGFLIDLNYVKRKFRVIAALNQLFSSIIEDPDLCQLKSDIVIRRDTLNRAICVSGDSGDKSYRTKGFQGELWVSTVIYSAPVLFLSMALRIKGFI